MVELQADLSNPVTTVTDEEFGRAVALSGPYAVVGVPKNDNFGFGAGIAYVHDAVTGALLHTLVSPTLSMADEFGSAVAIEGNLVLVGAPLDDPPSIANAGRAFLFNAADGSLLHTYMNPAPGDGDRFGAAVALSGGRALIGAWGDRLLSSDQSGSAYLFDGAPGYPLLHHFPNPTDNGNDHFGWSVALAGDTAVIGSIRDDDAGATNAGAAYVFDASTGLLTHTLYAPSPAANANFGTSVAILNSQVLVGSPGEAIGSAAAAGRVHVFDSGTGSWAFEIPNPRSGEGERSPRQDRFGSAVSASGVLALVGAPDIALSKFSAVYLYDMPTGDFLAALGRPGADNPAGPDAFGASVALDGMNCVAGAPFKAADLTALGEVGAAYYFDLMTTLCCEGDADQGCGFVDANDFISVQANFGAANGPGGPGDASCEGLFVDGTDFIAVQAHFGAECGLEKDVNLVSKTVAGPGVPLVRFDLPGRIVQVGDSLTKTAILDTNGAEVTMTSVFVDFDPAVLQFDGGSVFDAIWDNPTFNVQPSTHAGHHHVCLNAARTDPFTVNAQGVTLAGVDFTVIGEGLARMEHMGTLLSETMTVAYGPGYVTHPQIALPDSYVLAISGAISADDLIAVASALPDTAFDQNPGQRRGVLVKQLESVRSKIEGGQTNAAIQKLENSIRGKADGCVGGNPNNDWITDCAAQAVFIEAIDALLAVLAG